MNLFLTAARTNCKNIQYEIHKQVVNVNVFNVYYNFFTFNTAMCCTSLVIVAADIYS